MNPADIHEAFISTWRLIDSALTVGVFIALGAIAITLAVREVGSARRTMARYL